MLISYKIRLHASLSSVTSVLGLLSLLNLCLNVVISISFSGWNYSWC